MTANQPEPIRPIIRACEAIFTQSNPNASSDELIAIISRAQAEAAKLGYETTITTLAIMKRRIIWKAAQS
jgi:hypothetical protein